MMYRLFILWLFLANVTFAQPRSNAAAMAGSAFRLGFGAEGIGYGNARVSSLSDITTGYYNPALLPFRIRPIATLSIGLLSLDRNLNFMSYSNALKPSAGISLSFINAGVSNIDGRDADGNKTGTLSTSENSFMLSFGVLLNPRIAIGISTKILYYHIYSGVQSTTVGFDFGVAALLSDEWTVGASLQDIGSKYKWDTTNLYGLSGNSTIERFPIRKKIGVTFTPGAFPFQASAELEHLAQTLFMKVGASFSPLPSFTLRTGLDRFISSDSVLPKPSLGFTGRTEIASMKTDVSYTYVVEPYVPSGIHLLAISMEF